MPFTGGAGKRVKFFRRDMDDYLDRLNEAHEEYRDRLVETLVERPVLPTLSRSALRLVTLAEDENCSLEDVETVILLDPGLTSRCLKVASTSAYSRQPISTIGEALMMLGQRQVRHIAFTIEVMNAFDRFRHSPSWQDFWLHSLLTARLADVLARAFDLETGREYLAGLLHDAGEILLEREFPEAWNRARPKRPVDPDETVEPEVFHLGVHHAMVGAAIAQGFNLHPAIVRAIALHHDPPRKKRIKRNAEHRDFLPACLAMADWLAHQAAVAGTEADRILPEEQPGWESLAAFKNTWTLDLDLGLELQNAQRDLGGLL